jgi:hypothetical protein
MIKNLRDKFGLYSILSALIAMASVIYAIVLYKTNSSNTIIFFCTTLAMAVASLSSGGVWLGLVAGGKHNG